MPVVDISFFSPGNVVSCDLGASLRADTAYNCQLLPGRISSGYTVEPGSAGSTCS